jgi:PilZ domain
VFAMGAFAAQNAIIKDSEDRKDSRILFNGKNPVTAKCFTTDSQFTASIQDLCTSGVFINTDRKFSVGQEISLIFHFPTSGKKMMASGEIVRATYSGIGVKFNILFKK